MSGVSPTSNNGSLTRYYNKILGDSEKEKQAEIKRIREASERELDRVTDSYKYAVEQNIEAAENAINNLKEDSNEALYQERTRSRESLDQAKEQLYNQKGQYEDDRAWDKRLFETFVDDTNKRKELDNKTLKAHENDQEKRLEEAEHNNIEKLKEFKENQFEAAETTKQNNKNLVTELQKESTKQLNDGVARNTERENQARREIRQMNESYQAQLDKQDKNLRNKDQYYGGLAAETVAQKERQYNELFNSQNIEHKRDFDNLEKNFETRATNTDERARKEEARRDEAASRQIVESRKTRELALEEQGKNYQKALSDQRKNNLDTITELQDKLQKTQTTSDINLISPSSEEGMRKDLTKNFEKTFSAERDKHKEFTTELLENKASELKEAREDYQEQITKANRAYAASQALERSENYGNLLDSELETTAKLQDKGWQSARQTEILQHHYGRLLDKQKKASDNAFDSSRILAQNRINEIRQDSELALRMAHKDHVAKTNILIKDFKKKLADQKENQDIKLDDIKTQNANELRIAEMKFKADLAAQAKSYEVKIAQNQAQSNERERVISQNFQDELDRTRRAYELVIQKKS
ncbi:MAG: hypothetical protein ABIQ95_15025 [Bdellovibrionia bacterium]